MAHDIATTEPTEIIVGDRVQWTKSFSEYPATAESWTLNYYLRANLPGGQINITASASGEEYAVDVSPSVSNGWTPGIYFWEAYVSKTGSRYKVGEGSITLKPDFSAIELPHDGRSHARKTLDSINAVIEGRATSDIQRYVVQAVGRSIDKMPIADLLKFRDYYFAEVKKEEGIANGGRGKNIFIRFT